MNTLHDLLSTNSSPAALDYRYFPTRHQAVIFRNWEMVPPDLLAQVLKTDEKTILAAAQDMGLRIPPRVNDLWQKRGYITIIRNNWHLLPVDQLLQLLGWNEKLLVKTLKEDDFLWTKLGKHKPAAAKVIYRPLVYKEHDRTQRLKKYLREYFPSESDWHPFGFLDDFDHPLTWARREYSVPGLGEFALDDNWYIHYESSSFLDGLVGRFKLHMEQAFGLKLAGTQKTITLRLEADKSRLSESHSIYADPDGIIIQAVDEPGLMRGIHWLEDIFEQRGAPILKAVQITRDTKFDLRMLYPYAAVYGDLFTDPEADPLPAGLLERLSRAGINGVWLQAVLYLMTPFPFDPALSSGWEERIAGLNRLVEKAKQYGIGVYLYLNEPRALPSAFFDQHPQLAGSVAGPYTCLCTSRKEVQDYLRDASRQLFTLSPDLAGIITITMSENLTNCWSRGPNRCPVCATRQPYEVIGEVNRCIAEGVHAASSSARVICWSWAWKQANGWKNEDVPAAVDLLPAQASLMCTSESEIPYTIGGVSGSVADYSISIPGPGDRAKLFWQHALHKGMPAMAKLQINNTWECAAVPYLPVLDLVREHLDNLYDCGVTALMLSWTLGGYPSANLALASRYYWMEEPGSFHPEATGVAEAAQTVFSQAFREFPFHINVLYRGPQNFGPMNPLLPKPSGYAATMLGFPYDDLPAWRGIYPEDVFISQLNKLCTKWEKGLELLDAAPPSPQIDEIATLARATLYHFQSALLQSRYVQLRDALPDDTDIAAYNDYIQDGSLLDIIRQERDLAISLWQLMNKDPRIGFEASNHYFYTEASLKEKVLNCQYLLDQVFVPIVRQVDIEEAIRQLGITAGDIVLVHSSLSSLGKVENGAQTVIDAFEAVLGADGTLVFPTLCQEDFARSYETWHLDKPSDVGYLTEYFRKLPGVYRSDQATHSVAARGRMAYELTSEHTAYGPRFGIFGEYAFSRSSPWQKMYDKNGKVVFLGVSMRKNTFKHFMEYIVVDETLARISNEEAHEQIKNRIWDFAHYANRAGRVWPFHNAEQLQQKMAEEGLLRKSHCYGATLICVNIRDMVDQGLKWFLEDPPAWYDPDVLTWLSDADAAMDV